MVVSAANLLVAGSGHSRYLIWRSPNSVHLKISWRVLYLHHHIKPPRLSGVTIPSQVRNLVYWCSASQPTPFSRSVRGPSTVITFSICIKIFAVDIISRSRAFRPTAGTKFPGKGEKGILETAKHRNWGEWSKEIGSTSAAQRSYPRNCFSNFRNDIGNIPKNSVRVFHLRLAEDNGLNWWLWLPVFLLEIGSSCELQLKCTGRKRM